MKIRNGFVSNSSSSSFIIATKGKTKTTITIEVDFKKYAKSIKTIKQLDEYMFEEFAGEIPRSKDDDYYKEYNKMKSAIEAGQIILAGNFTDDSDDEMERMLCETGLKKLIKDKDITIIQSEGGY